jgi:hypothetical protein
MRRLGHRKRVRGKVEGGRQNCCSRLIWEDAALGQVGVVDVLLGMEVDMGMGVGV